MRVLRHHIMQLTFCKVNEQPRILVHVITSQTLGGQALHLIPNPSSSNINLNLARTGQHPLASLACSKSPPCPGKIAILAGQLVEAPRGSKGREASTRLCVEDCTIRSIVDVSSNNPAAHST